jgi:DNA-binding CsgD family transcriptional regulator
MNHYYTYDHAMECWATLVANGLSGEQQAIKVCEAFIQAYRERPGLAAAGLELIEAGLPDRLKGLLLSTYLTGYLATHMSLHVNRSLRRGIDERREENETRFARLLKELPAEALDAYRQRPRSPGDLMDVRTEVARRLERREVQSARKELAELAAFADRETLLKLAKGARLSAQELEVFELCATNPGISYKEIAARLGMKSTSQVGVVKHRIKHKLIAAGR